MPVSSFFPCLGNPHPVGFYPLDGIARFNDTSACRNLPGISKGATLAPGYVGKPHTAYRVNGSEESYIRLPTSSKFNPRSITLLAWFKTESSAGQHMILQFSSIDALAILLAIDLRTPYLELSSRCEKVAVSVYTNIRIRNFTWYFSGFSYNDVTRMLRVWISDEDSQYFFVGDIRLDTNHDLWLGNGPKSPGVFIGSVACVQLYDRAFDQGQVEEAQKLCLPREWSGLYDASKCFCSLTS